MEDLIAKLKLAMVYDEEGSWDKAHETVQDLRHEVSYRIHAYLHRKEGDFSNANYWYRRVGVEPFQGSLKAERKDILYHLTAMGK